MDTSSILLSIVLPVLTGILMPIIILYLRRHISIAEALNTQRFKNIENMLHAQNASIEQQIKKLEERLQSYDNALERVRDRWDQFLREYVKIDNSRGSKIDAMFRVLDTVNEKIRQTRDDIERLRSLEEHIQDIKLRVVTLETIITKAGQK